MASPTLANLVTNSAAYTKPTLTERDQRLLRLAGKLRVAATALHTNTNVNFSSGTNADWKNLLNLVEGQAVMGPIGRDAIMAAYARNMFFIADNNGNTYAQRYNMILPVLELDPLRLERLELYVDFIAYDGILNAA